ncbi:MAG: adenosylmethionine--8-amino-7-oxononanoate transaminase [Elusimicrobia bacterium RIFCSPLOWO2_01_FULL_54_10]|nr:MAG: adenosylmethionine--8-amino-7-oxononanoate transaminase [Elusimicrobia bacterium RIFCSPLOWO2_01_FULL_54_10]
MKRAMILSKEDKKYLWHPFTQQWEWERSINEKPLVIERGNGNYLYDTSGRKYFDGVSSLWANLHGHRNPAIDRAIKQQLAKVAHSTFLGLTHEPGIRLAEELVKIAPKGLSRVFYSDNGSTAVEVALKMAFQYHAQKKGGKARPVFLSLKESYHGDTLGAVSVGGIDLFHEKFAPLLFKRETAMSPHCHRCPHNRSQIRHSFYGYRGEKPMPGDFRKETGCRWECLAEVENKLKKNKGKIAAAILEPVVQGAAGIRAAPPGYLWGFARLCKKYGTLLIADEVATGFGRTGKAFACEQENVSPDILCLAKGISGGYLPLAATLATETIYRAFLGKCEEFKTFFHGHTYTANPLACAAGLASLSLLKQKLSGARLKRIISVLRKGLERIAKLPQVSHVRAAGLMAGIELVPFHPSERIGKKICMRLRKLGVLLRPLGDVLVLMPPLSSSETEIKDLTDMIDRAIRAET